MTLAGRINSLCGLFGLELPKLGRTVTDLPGFLVDYARFRRLHGGAANDFVMGKLYPCLGEARAAAGMASGHYFHQDILVARRILERRPSRHADVGSRIDGFVAHLAVFREVEVFDIRALQPAVRNIVFRQADVLKGVEPSLEGVYDSVSCLHALEHFGLGRYGDGLDYFGHLKGLDAISRLLCPGGILYLSVPIGPQRIEFNAHRVFAISYLREICADTYRIERFSYVNDDGELIENASYDDRNADGNYGCRYGLDIFEMIKK